MKRARPRFPPSSIKVDCLFIVYPRYYGIEAAYKTIVREVTNVFGVYGIEVDYR